MEFDLAFFSVLIGIAVGILEIFKQVGPLFIGYMVDLAKNLAVTHSV